MAPNGRNWPTCKSRPATRPCSFFALAVVFVFLVLAAQYESWSLPLAVILVVPMCLLCSVVGVRSAGMEVNIFTQIGFVVLVGLASKNAILIVEFAKQQQEAGIPRRAGDAGGVPAATAADPDDFVRLHLRRGAAGDRAGAGAEMRRSLGLAVFSGMLGVTFFGIFLTPVFYYVIQWFGGTKAVHEVHVHADNADLAILSSKGRSDSAATERRNRVGEAAASSPKMVR